MKLARPREWAGMMQAEGTRCTKAWKPERGNSSGNQENKARKKHLCTTSSEASQFSNTSRVFSNSVLRLTVQSWCKPHSQCRPHKTAPISAASCSLRSPVLLTDNKLEVPIIPSLGFIICYISSQKSGRHFTCQFVIKETNQQPDEEVRRERSGRIPSTGASVSMKLGYTTLQAHG